MLNLPVTTEIMTEVCDALRNWDFSVSLVDNWDYKADIGITNDEKLTEEQKQSDSLGPSARLAALVDTYPRLAVEFLNKVFGRSGLNNGHFIFTKYIEENRDKIDALCAAWMNWKSFQGKRFCSNTGKYLVSK